MAVERIGPLGAYPGSIETTASGLKLSGDSAAPGNSMVYGTDGTGTKGWQASQNVATTASPSFVGATLTGLTAGSVLFAGASKEVAQDNSYFYYDDTNNRLGIGNKAPVGVIHANHSALANVGVFERSGITTDAVYASGRILATKTTNMNDGFGAALIFSIQDDAAVINNVGYLGFIRAGNDTTGKFTLRNYNSGSATETFSITNTGAGSLLSGMTINENGDDADTRIEGDTDANLIVCDASADKVGIGTATPAEKLDVVGNIKVSGNLTDGTNSATMAELAPHLTNVTDPHGATATPTASSIVMSAASGRLSWGWEPSTMCCLFLPSNQSTASGDWRDLAFHDGAELIDDGLHNDDVSGAYTRITIAASGYYRFTCRATFAGVATGVRSIRLRKNGATLASSGPNITATASDTTLEINQIHYCSASDYYQMQTYHDRGSNLNVLGGGEYTVFQCVRVR